MHAKKNYKLHEQKKKKEVKPEWKRQKIDKMHMQKKTYNFTCKGKQ